WNATPDPAKARVDPPASKPAAACACLSFLDDHAEAEIVPALQDLAFLACLRNAGSRRVIVKTRMIEIEPRRVIVEPDYRGVIPATEGGFNAELRLIIFRTFLNSARARLARVRIALARAIISNRRKR